jgi:putative heme-binding domain-containing protein
LISPQTASRDANAASQTTDWQELASRQTPCANPYDESASLNDRARAYLHVNCAHCHRFGGGGTAYIQLQRELSLDETKTVGVKPTQGTFGIPNPEILAAGDPYRSVLYYRMAKLGSGRMPHLGSELVDERGIRLMHDWIRQLPVRAEEDALIEQLAGSAAKSKDARRKPTNSSKPELIKELLSSTSRALRVVQALDTGRFPAAASAEILAAAAEHPEAPIRDLFERFLPAEQRVRRLGPSPNSAELLALRGDAAQGRELFLQAAALQCKTCHQVAGAGGRVGPDLSQIGKKYNRAQILENLLTPSRTIEPKFQTHVVVTEDGRVLTGVVMERDASGLVMRDAKDVEIRLAAGDIASTKPVGQSLMPDQLLRDLTPQQAADLLAFLESLR